MPLLNDTHGQRHAISRNRQTGTRIEIQEMSRWSIRVNCLEHAQGTSVSTWSEGCTTARLPQNFCTVCAQTPVQNRQQRRSARRTGEALGQQRKFGCEFEFYGIARPTVQAWLDSSGMRANGWKVVSDCSVRGTTGSHRAGLELVSPPLRGDEGFAQIRTALTWLHDNGAKVNTTAGTHVHHDASDMNIDSIKRFVHTYAANQNLIDWLVSPSRRNNTGYTRPWTQAELTAMDAHSYEGRPYSPNRYRTVNLSAYGRHGTLEIRQHQGTLSVDKIVSWIKLGQALMDAAKTGTSALSAQTGIKSLLDNVRCDEEAAAFLLGRAIQFGAPAAMVVA